MHFVQSRCAPLIPHSLSHSTGLSLSSLSYYSPIVLFSFTQSTDNYSLFDRPTYTVEAVPLHLHFLPLMLHFSAWPDRSILALLQKKTLEVPVQQTHLPSDPSVLIYLLCPHLSSSQRPITRFFPCSARSPPQAPLAPLFPIIILLTERSFFFP